MPRLGGRVQVWARRWPASTTPLGAVSPAPPRAARDDAARGPADGLGPAGADSGLAPWAATLLLLPHVPEVPALGSDDITPMEG
jgi:hypothetical protein